MNQNLKLDSHRVENLLDIVHLFGAKHHVRRHLMARSGQEVEEDVGIVKLFKEEEILGGQGKIGNSEDLEAANGSFKIEKFLETLRVGLNTRVCNSQPRQFQCILNGEIPVYGGTSLARWETLKNIPSCS